MEEKVYNQDGREVGKIKLPEAVFGLPWNADLVHETVTSILSSRRRATAHVKDRGAVRGGGKKPWQQKGTGRARHGSSRSPIWVGGGVAHGPSNEKNYNRKVNGKAMKKVVGAILSAKLRDREIIFIDRLSVPNKKTSEASSIFNSIAKIPEFAGLLGKKKNALLIASPKAGDDVRRGFRNIGNVTVMETRMVNPVDLLSYRYILIVDPEESVKVLETRV